MKIIRRNAVVAVAVTPEVATEMLAAIPATIAAVPPAPESAAVPKAKRGRKAKAESAEASQSENQSDGEKLAHALEALIGDSDMPPKERDAKLVKIGKAARALMPDPDASAMEQRARASQHGLDIDTAVMHWSAAFLTGWTAKRVSHDGESKPKPYRLVVDIPSIEGSEPEHHEQRYENTVAAEWAAARWMTVKVDCGDLVRCRIETLDLTAVVEKGQPIPAIAALSYDVTFDSGRATMARAIRRAKLAPPCWVRKTKGGPFGTKAKNFTATFSHG